MFALLQDDPRYKLAVRSRNPQSKLRIVLKACSTKSADDRTGAPQPKYRIDGMKIMMEFPKPNGQDDEMGAEAITERKQVGTGCFHGVQGSRRSWWAHADSSGM